MCASTHLGMALMRLRLLVSVMLALVAGMLIAPPATAAPASRVIDLCAGAQGIALNVSGAAQVLLPPARGKRPKPAGSARAEALAADLLAGGNPCTDPLDEYSQYVVDEILAMIDSGDIEGATYSIRSYIEGLAPYDPGDDDPGYPTVNRTVRAGVCEGFERHNVSMPYEVALGLELAKLASMVGDQDIAELAVSQAQAAAQKWAEGGANGEASSVGDWLTLANAAALLALDDAVVQSLIDKARGVAEESYKFYNRLPCRMDQEKLDCFFKAAMAVALIGGSSISDERMSEDLLNAVDTARKIKSGKKPRCTVEKYAFRMKFENEVDNGQMLTFDTGRVVFTVKDGKITSPDKGPLILSTVKDQACYAKRDNSGWVKEGSANLKGGRFPYTVGGTDDGDNLTLILAQQGSWRVTGSGSLECQMLIGLADMFLNAYPRMFAAGLELPAGSVGYDQADSGFEFHEPTGTNRSWSSYFEFRLLEPKR